MTIKTQGGKVITKDGKVSCECCAQPEGCCMYPAQALIDGEYGIDDLPDTIIVWIESTILNKAAEAFPSPSVGDLLVYYEGSYLIDGESYLIEVGLFDGIWRTWDERFFEELYGNDCLITSLILEDELIQDQFADTYTINDPDEGKTYAVNRISLCVWEQDPGIDENGDPIEQARLLYRSKRDEGVADNDAPIWVVDTPSVSGTFKKTGFQNTPIGTYSNPPSTDITVS
jgi:hypothetical protein